MATSGRRAPRRPALGMLAVVAAIGEGKGILYDEAVADACVALITERGFRLQT